LLGADFSHGLCLDPLSKLVDHDKKVCQALGRLVEGSWKVQSPYGEWLGNGDHLEHLGRGVNMSSNILASPVRSHDL
jgi:hypothetical protein